MDDITQTQALAIAQDIAEQHNLSATIRAMDLDSEHILSIELDNSPSHGRIEFCCLTWRHCAVQAATWLTAEALAQAA